MLITFFIIFGIPKLSMKKFFSVFLLFISINVFSQNIDSVSVTPILCNGDSTCATVYTDDTSGFVFYDLYIFNPSINNWMHHPNYPSDQDKTGLLA